jgi:hypothetical protein
MSIDLALAVYQEMSVYRRGPATGLLLIALALLWNPTSPPVARADGRDEAREPQIAGLVYKVKTLGDMVRLTVYALDIRHAVDVYVKDPALLALVERGDVCTNRYVRVVGTRVDLDTMEAQGLQVDTDRPCGPPPR